MEHGWAFNTMAHFWHRWVSDPKLAAVPHLLAPTVDDFCCECEGYTHWPSPSPSLSPSLSLHLQPRLSEPRKIIIWSRCGSPASAWRPGNTEWYKRAQSRHTHTLTCAAIYSHVCVSVKCQSSQKHRICLALQKPLLALYIEMLVCFRLGLLREINGILRASASKIVTQTQWKNCINLFYWLWISLESTALQGLKKICQKTR